LVLAFWGWGFARNLYNRVFIDQPVGYKEINPKTEIHHYGIDLGHTGHVQFFLYGPRRDNEDFDDWRIVAEMHVPDSDPHSDLVSCLPQFARAAELHSYGRVVLLPKEEKALVVDSDEENMLVMDAIGN
jgi:hypothetical protein